MVRAHSRYGRYRATRGLTRLAELRAGQDASGGAGIGCAGIGGVSSSETDTFQPNSTETALDTQAAKPSRAGHSQPFHAAGMFAVTEAEAAAIRTANRPALRRLNDAWDAFADDQLELVDHLGIREFFCIGYRPRRRDTSLNLSDCLAYAGDCVVHEHHSVVLF